MKQPSNLQPVRWHILSLALPIVLAAAACDDSDELNFGDLSSGDTTSDTSGDTTSDTSGDTGGDTSGDTGGDVASPDGCEPPAGAEVVMPWTVLASDATQAAPAYDLATDGTSLYANFFDVIVSVPLAGGAATEVYRSPAEIPLGFSMWADATGLILEESGTWTRVPFGGAATPLTVDLTFTADVFEVDAAAGALYAVVEDFAAGTRTLVRATLDGAAATTLVGPTDVGRNQKWFRAGDRFFTTGSPAEDFTPDPRIFLFEVGQPVPVEVSLDPASDLLVAVTDDALFYATNRDVTSWGLFRAGLSGGTTDRIFDGYFIGASRGNAHDVGSSVYLNDATQLWRLSESGDAAVVAMVPAGACTTHTVHAHEGFVYTVTFNSSTGENQIWRVADN